MGSDVAGGVARNPARDYGEELAVLNKLLARETRRHELVAIKRRLELLERPHFPDAER